MAGLPFILKGVATAEDAAIAVEHGVSAIYVSNHGGRQLDHGRATIDMLPEIVDVNMPADSLVIGEWDAAKLFLGQGFRVDSSSEAGERWDRNLTGFRGEEEIAFNASPALYTGAFQRLIDTKA